MMRTWIRANRLSAAIVSAGLVSATTALAQPLVLEEVMVTAQMRVQSLQDVPVSVSAVSGSKLMQAGIDKIEDLQAYVPNLSMSETGIGTNIYIRGIGSGINQGFEQSVGMYVDGVSYGRAQLSRAPFLDLTRVEVLRGPQNILFGKNSIAGALSIITAKPTDELEGSVSVLYEPDHNEQVYDVIVSGPITNGLAARLAYRDRSMDGYMDNLTLNSEEPNRDEQTLRFTLQWEASEDLDLTLKVENSTFDIIGRQIEIVNEAPSATNGLTYAQTLFGSFNPLGVGSDVLNNTADFKRSSNGDSSDNETDNITFTANYALGDHTLTFITALMEYEYDELCDCDFTGADIFTVRSQEEYEQLSQEIRFTSAVGGEWEFIGGFFYQTSELDFRDRITLAPTSILPFALNARAALDPQLAALLGSTPGSLITQTTVPRQFSTDTDIYSLFLQATWNIHDSLRLTLGGRYTHEEKEGARRLTITDLNNNELPFDIGLEALAQPVGVDAVYDIVFKVNRHDLAGERTEEKFSPLVNVQYDVNDDTMLYATLSQGSKSGGYDARANAGSGISYVIPTIPVNTGTFEFEDEQATSFELGAKMALLDGAAELNVAGFYTDYSDLQVSIFDGTLGFNVGNAGEAETIGLELDGRWRATENLTLIGSLALLDFEFTDFDNGQCNFGETPTSKDGRNCNYDGRTNQYVADFSGTLTADYQRLVGSTMEVRATVDLVFTDDYNPTQTLDPTMDQDGYTKLNARVALSGNNNRWEVALVGKNLTDEEIITYANATPLAGTSFGVSSHYAFFERGQTVAVQGTYRF